MKRVTTKPHKDLDGLKMLAAFLDFDWESGDSKQLEKMTKDVHPFYRVLVVEGALEDRDKAKAVQAELRTDLVPIFRPEEKVDPEKACFRIDKLLRKLNEIESKAEWVVEPIEYEWESTDPRNPDADAALRLLEPDEIKSKSYFFHPTAELNLLSYRWNFGQQFKGMDCGFSREALYQLLLDAFKSGTIERFRTCTHCKAFVVAEDARQQFCSDEHRNDFYNKQRLESGWFKDRRSRKRKRDLALARKLLREGKSATQIAKETKLPRRVLKREGVIH